MKKLFCLCCISVLLSPVTLAAQGGFDHKIADHYSASSYSRYVNPLIGACGEGYIPTRVLSAPGE